MKEFLKQSFWIAFSVLTIIGTFMGTKAREMDNNQETGFPPFITAKHGLSLGIEAGVIIDRYSGAHYGLSVAPMRASSSDLYGIAIAFANLSENLGGSASPETVTGLQIGLYNHAKAGKGVVQIGLWNVIRRPDGKKRSTPIINLSFPR